MDRQISKEEQRKAKIKKSRPYIIGTVAVVVLGTILMFSLQSSVSRDDLLIATADTGSIQTSVTGSGSVVPAFEEIINSPISTRIVEVYCKAGDSVDVGTPLLRLDLQNTETELNKLKDQIAMKRYELEQQEVNNDTRVKDLDMQVKVKEMAVNRMEVELRNERYLDSLGSGTGDKVREAELKYNTGKLELEQMRQKLESERRVTAADRKVKNLEINIAEKNLGLMNRTLDDARIRSPRKATLTYINDQIGQKISEGEQIAVISDLSHFKVDGEIADSYGDRIGVGSKVMVKAGRMQLPGYVTNVTPLSKNGVISYSVRLDEDNHAGLRSGLKTDVYILCDIMENVTRIKNGSFYTGPGSYELFVMTSDDELQRRTVRLGDSNYEYVEVVSGIEPGEKVILNDMKRFKESSTVKIK